MGGGRIFLKTLCAFLLMTTNWMSLISTGSISLDSTFKGWMVLYPVWGLFLYRLQWTSYMDRCMKSDSASRVQMMGIHPIVFSRVGSKKSGLVRSCHETAQLTTHSSSEGFRKETFLANAKLAGCNWNSPRYFCTQITNIRRDHPLSGSSKTHS
jgi:hypothetical protein